MQRVRQHGKGWRKGNMGKPLATAVLIGLLAAALPLMAGCGGTGIARTKDHPQQVPEVDPLVGGIQPSKEGPYKVPTPAPMPNKQKANSTPAAPASSTTSTVELSQPDILVGGRPIFFLERAGDKLVFFPAAPDEIARGVEGLVHLAGRRRHRELRIVQVNGVPALRSEHVAALEAAGLRVEPGSLVVRGG